METRYPEQAAKGEKSGDDESGRNLEEIPGKEVEVVWACHAKSTV